MHLLIDLCTLERTAIIESYSLLYLTVLLFIAYKNTNKIREQEEYKRKCIDRMSLFKSMDKSMQIQTQNMQTHKTTHARRHIHTGIHVYV